MPVHVIVIGIGVGVRHGLSFPSRCTWLRLNATPVPRHW